jgi:hypothetical protein
MLVSPRWKPVRSALSVLRFGLASGLVGVLMLLAGVLLPVLGVYLGKTATTRQWEDWKFTAALVILFSLVPLAVGVVLSVIGLVMGCAAPAESRLKKGWPLGAIGCLGVLVLLVVLIGLQRVQAGQSQERGYGPGGPGAESSPYWVNVVGLFAQLGFAIFTALFLSEVARSFRHTALEKNLLLLMKFFVLGGGIVLVTELGARLIVAAGPPGKAELTIVLILALVAVVFQMALWVWLLYLVSKTRETVADALRGRRTPAVTGRGPAGDWHPGASARPAGNADPAWPGLGPGPGADNHHKSIQVALAALLILITLNVAGTADALLTENKLYIGQGISLGVGALVLWGFAARHRLAWQWGRVLGLICAVLSSVAVLVIFFTRVDPEVFPLGQRLLFAALSLGVAACYFVIFFAFGKPDAREYFRLYCPSCGRPTRTAGDFLFTTAKCQRCGEVW